MSQPLRLRMMEEPEATPPPVLQIVPAVEPTAPGSTPPTLNPDGPAAVPPPIVLATFAAQTGGNFLSPEEVDVVAGFEEQAALEAATESHAKGFLGGALAALACTVIAGVFAALSGHWYGFLSIGIGFAVAFGVRKMGRGNSAQFGLIGATWALLGCLGAYHLASAIVMAREEGVGFFEFVQGIESWSSFMHDVLGPRDFFFYAIAAYFGYKRSYDAVSDSY